MIVWVNGQYMSGRTCDETDSTNHPYRKSASQLCCPLFTGMVLKPVTGLKLSWLIDLARHNLPGIHTSLTAPEREPPILTNLFPADLNNTASTTNGHYRTTTFRPADPSCRQTRRWSQLTNGPFGAATAGQLNMPVRSRSGHPIIPTAFSRRV
ncbi:hypothetical protein RRG08_027848 [Elysia crispata]|uniref:Uncharacterized protein n=1 Tax=Elysia crispata TaxID=231223 RepID=A0AAE1D4U7_9GAST|nr:hypothetical protein RRG08_027848 [Elysia crispata]